jgi:hypothetical protein
MSSATSQLRYTASRAANSKPLEYLARGGFVCYGVIHLLLAWVALQVAFGNSKQESDPTGALQKLASQPAGKTLVVIVVIGMVALAIWQAFAAIIGESGEQDKEAIAERVISGVRAIIYLWLAWIGVKVVRGAASSQAKSSQNTTSNLMDSTGGRWLVGLIGLVVVGVGIGLIWYGLTKRFEKHLNTQQMSPTVRKTTRRLGMVGYPAKGVAYGVVGILLLAAAVTYDPGKARGLDGALKTLGRHSWGIWVLVLIALGFVAFGIYCFSQARYRKV